MKKMILSLVLSLFLAVGAHAQYEELNYMAKAFPDAELEKTYDNIEQWRKWKKADVMREIAALPGEQKEALIRDAEQYLDYDWPALPASVFLEFKETGNRSNFQALYHQRRNILSTLAAAELYEGKGRFTRAVMNGLWVVLEESDWCYPAHQGQKGNRTGLPLPGFHIVDLFAGETSANVSWIAFLLEEQLNAITPTTVDKVHYEIDKRIWQPYIAMDFTNMGLDKKPSNNWNPWINKNCFYTMILNPMPRETFMACMRRMVPSLDNYLNWYPKDGGCDEGPGYWSGSPLYFAEMLETLHEVNPQAAQKVIDEPLIKLMASYIYNMQIGGSMFVNFADANSRIRPSAARTYRYGKMVNDPKLVEFAAYFSGGDRFVQSFSRCGSVLNLVFTLKAYPGLVTEKAVEPLPVYAAYEELGTMVARDRAGSPDGLFLATQGGHNAQSHNHNDVGNFIVYYNASPVLIDVGVENYTAKTFGSERYTIWTMQSAWHNTPTINGVMQMNGREYRATDTHFANTSSSATFRANIGTAYPAEAGVDNWTRTLTLNRGRNVTLRDVYTLNKVVAPVELNFVTVLDADTAKPGTVLLSGTTDAGETYTLKMAYDAKQYDVLTESVPVTDSRLKASWDEGPINRIRLVARNQQKKGDSRVVITVAK